MTTAQEDIATYLASLGFGSLGNSLFVDYRPPTPDNLITVSGYAGRAPERTHDGSGNESPSIQVWIRNTSRGTCRTKATQIFNALDGISNTTLSGNFYLGVMANQSPELINIDENGRIEYVVNFAVIKRR